MWHRVIDNIPARLFYGTIVPEPSFYRFGCLAFVRTKPDHKLDTLTLAGIFLSFAETSSYDTVLIYNPNSKRVLKRHMNDIIFDENINYSDYVEQNKGKKVLNDTKPALHTHNVPDFEESLNFAPNEPDSPKNSNVDKFMLEESSENSKFAPTEPDSSTNSIVVNTMLEETSENTDLRLQNQVLQLVHLWSTPCLKNLPKTRILCLQSQILRLIQPLTT